MNPIRISETVYYVGSNDRRTQLFENYWPLEKGVAYNSYLLLDTKTALIETVELSKVEDLIEKVKILLQGRTLDYLVINHMEPDHSGAIRALLREYPELVLVGNKKTFPLLQGFYGIVKNHKIVEEEDILDLGYHKLTFYTMPMVHWPESMVTYDKTEEILFSNDAFGSFGTLDGGLFDDETNLEFYEDELRRYYSNIVGKYGSQVQKTLEKLLGLSIKMIAPSHGLLWRTNILHIVQKYQEWSTFKAEKGVVIVFGSLYGNTEKTAEAIARSLSEEGVKNIRVYDASKTHISYILSDIWKYNGLVIGTAAYNGSIFTPISHFMHHLKHIGIKNKVVAIFGNACWGSAVRELNKLCEEASLEVVNEPFEAKCSPTSIEFDKAAILAKAVASRI